MALLYSKIVTLILFVA